MDLIDMHNHILPAVDDGSKSLEMSLAMVKCAISEGIHTLIMTPHYHPHKGTHDLSVWQERYSMLRRAVMERNLDVQLYMGCEVFFEYDVPKLIEAGRIPTMVQSRYVLVEFDFDAEYDTIRSGLMDILDMELVPIFAHVERFEAIFGHADRVRDLRDMGILIQLNSDDVVGEAGLRMKYFCKKLLKRGYVDFIGTDAHRDIGRAPLMKNCYNYVVKKCGEEYANLIMHDNAMRIINNEEIE